MIYDRAGMEFSPLYPFSFFLLFPGSHSMNIEQQGKATYRLTVEHGEKLPRTKK